MPGRTANRSSGSSTVFAPRLRPKPLWLCLLRLGPLPSGPGGANSAGLYLLYLREEPCPFSSGLGCTGPSHPVAPRARWPQQLSSTESQRASRGPVQRRGCEGGQAALSCGPDFISMSLSLLQFPLL